MTALPTREQRIYQTPYARCATHVAILSRVRFGTDPTRPPALYLEIQRRGWPVEPVYVSRLPDGLSLPDARRVADVLLMTWALTDRLQMRTRREAA